MIQSTGINQTFDKRVNRCKDDLQGGGSSTTPSLTSQLHPLHPKNIPQPLISPYRKQQGLPHVGRGFRGSESCVFYPVLAASLQLPASISEFLTDTQLFPASHLLSPPPPSFPLHLSLRPPTGRTKRQMEDEEEADGSESVEDAEELERERRRRVRESYCWTDGGSMPGETSPEDGMPAEESISPSMEEDEGFSDWTQRRERRRQQRLQELSQGGEEEEEEENRKNKSAAVKSVQTSVTSSSRLQRQEHHQEDDEEEERVEMERRKNQEEEEFNRAQRMRREKEEEEEKRKREEVTIRRKEGVQKPKEVEKRKEVKISYTSKVFLNQEAKQSNGDATKEEVTTIKNQKTKRSTRGGGGNQELTELKMKREERRRVREEEECRREEEEHQKLAKEEEERRRMKEDMERRRVEASERMKSRSSSSVDGDEMFSPFSPKPPKVNITCSYMLLQYCCVPGFYCRNTASHCRHINSFKKTQPLGLLIKIDDKREQYAHAVENSQEARAVKASLSDLPGSPEVVSSKKNLFEAGETWSPSRGASCKDAEELKVGVANRITQWVKGPTDGSRTSLKPADVRPGDVMQKKKHGSAAGKKYKFVVTGHGKYEKIPVDEDGEEFADGEDGETQTQFSNM
ncbi:hypothetical protein F7725_023400 [Dissostichus mawsoni]|uniref:Uncharacterized protein n=1 Tax=Dissostichus mawsoni TaxID=36200 RepID=A0A7J5Z0L7_DISMA|nr:hypothetical protein F7725_023400 [Dissostichus mawsoni]